MIILKFQQLLPLKWRPQSSIRPKMVTQSFIKAKTVTHSSVVEFSVVMRETWVRVRVSTLLRSFQCDATL